MMAVTRPITLGLDVGSLLSPFGVQRRSRLAIHTSLIGVITTVSPLLDLLGTSTSTRHQPTATRLTVN
jgi:hypothetical protein